MPPGFELLQAYAQAKGWGLTEAAQNLLNAASAASQTLLDTERSKDFLLARIETLMTLSDVQQLEQELKELARALPNPTSLNALGAHENNLCLLPEKAPAMGGLPLCGLGLFDGAKFSRRFKRKREPTACPGQQHVWQSH